MLRSAICGKLDIFPKKFVGGRCSTKLLFLDLLNAKYKDMIDD